MLHHGREGSFRKGIITMQKLYSLLLVMTATLYASDKQLKTMEITFDPSSATIHAISFKSHVDFTKTNSLPASPLTRRKAQPRKSSSLQFDSTGVKRRNTLHSVSDEWSQKRMLYDADSSTTVTELKHLKRPQLSRSTYFKEQLQKEARGKLVTKSQEALPVVVKEKKQKKLRSRAQTIGALTALHKKQIEGQKAGGQSSDC